MKGDGIGRKPNQNRNQKGEGKSHVKIFQFQNKKELLDDGQQERDSLGRHAFPSSFLLLLFLFISNFSASTCRLLPIHPRPSP